MLVACVRTSDYMFAVYMANKRDRQVCVLAVVPIFVSDPVFGDTGIAFEIAFCQVFHTITAFLGVKQ